MKIRLLSQKTKTQERSIRFLSRHIHTSLRLCNGVENFTINEITVPSGIEIEDGGGEGTAGSHPECRIGSQDLMVGVSLQGDVGPYNRFTPLTAAMLLDTGNDMISCGIRYNRSFGETRNQLTEITSRISSLDHQQMFFHSSTFIVLRLIHIMIVVDSLSKWLAV